MGNNERRHDPESARHLIKALHLWGADTVAADDADAETKELVRRINEERAQSRASAQARWAAGRYFVDEVVILIGAQCGLNEFVREALCNDMLRCAALPDDHKHKLIVRDPGTLIPVQRGVRVSLVRILYRSDVNAWLDATEAGYRWNGDAPDPAVLAAPAGMATQGPPAGLAYWNNSLHLHIAAIDAKHPPQATALQAIAYLKSLGDPRLTPKSGDTPDTLQWRNNSGDPKSVRAKSVGNALPSARRWAAGSSNPS